MALGGQQSQVLWLIQRQGLALVLGGLAIGIPTALVLSRLMKSLLFHVNAIDQITFVTASAVLIIVSLVACYLPARRATRVDPISSLRYG